MVNCTNTFQEDPEGFFEWFYETYKRFVFKEASRYFDNPIDIEDLTQDVWMSVSRKGKQLSTYSSAQQFSYLAVSVKNRAISILRKRDHTIPLEFANNVSYNESNELLEEIGRRIVIDRFRKIWQNVPAEERELLERKYFLLESDAEIASAMGIQKNSVRMALSRARKKAGPFLKDLADFI